MGMFSGSESGGADSAIVDRARQDWDAGRRVFVARLAGGLRADGPDQWGRTVEVIEAIGWKLDRWAVGDQIGFPLFRRP